MERKINLSPEDCERIRARLSQSKWVDAEGKSVDSPEPGEYLLGLIDAWSKIVEEIASGYEFTIYDYTNDLSVRDEIAEMMQALTDNGKKALAELVDPIDERFKEATREIPISVLHPSETPSDYWWWYRVPTEPGEDLASDLRNRRLIE